MAEIDIKNYRDKFKEYQSVEDEFLNTLFNLERMPDDSELLNTRVVLKDSLNGLRDELKYLQLKALTSLDEWDAAVKKRETDYKTLKDVYEHIEKDLKRNLNR